MFVPPARPQHNRRESHPASIEPLENRTLLHGGFSGGGFSGGGFGGGGFGGGFGHNLNTIEFSQAPAAVQTGLEHLASADGLTPPTASSTQTVFLGNHNGVETYTIDLTGTGTQTALTVDQNGNPVTAPTNGTTTYGALPPAVTTEAGAIGTALNLSTPGATATVPVTTPAGGTSVYSIRLSPSASSTSTAARFIGGRVVEIDANGNPVGNQSLPFSIIPAPIQTALNNNRPAGATALATSSTQTVNIRTIDGIVTYSTRFTTSGTTTMVTVDAAGTLTSLPSHSTTTFSALSNTVQNAIQALASDNGVSGTIAGTTPVRVYTEANGTTVYSVTVNESKTGLGGGTYTYNLTISVDQNGNPTTPRRPTTRPANSAPPSAASAETASSAAPASSADGDIRVKGCREPFRPIPHMLHLSRPTLRARRSPLSWRSTTIGRAPMPPTTLPTMPWTAPATATAASSPSASITPAPRPSTTSPRTVPFTATTKRDKPRVQLRCFL